MKNLKSNPVLHLFKNEFKKRDNLKNIIASKKVQLSNLSKDLCAKISQEILAEDMSEATRELLSFACLDGRNGNQKLISILVRRSLRFNSGDSSIDYRFPMIKILSLCKKFHFSNTETILKDLNSFSKIKFNYQIYSNFISINVQFA